MNKEYIEYLQEMMSYTNDDNVRKAYEIALEVYLQLHKERECFAV